MRRRTLLKGSIGGGIDASVAPPMSVVFANKKDNSLTIVEGGKWSTAAYPPSIFEPIGIVVIPGEHGVLKDGTGNVNQCGVISIKEMDYRTPETGGTNVGQIMYWGYNNLDISGKSDGLGRYDSVSNGLLNCNSVACDTSGSNIATKIILPAYMPRQGSVGGTPTWYRLASNYVPSPYAGDDLMSGGYNEYYGTTKFNTSSNRNALSDFKGIVNTKIITDLATGEDWRNLSSLSNSYNTSGVYPAACCCARFHTTGTKAFIDCTTEELRNGTGFWYLPAIGELGYIPPRLYDINATINSLKSSYGVGINLGTEGENWSSSEYSGGSAYTVEKNYGKVDSNYNSKYKVRAFLRL